MFTGFGIPHQPLTPRGPPHRVWAYSGCSVVLILPAFLARRSSSANRREPLQGVSRLPPGIVEPAQRVGGEAPPTSRPGVSTGTPPASPYSDVKTTTSRPQEALPLSCKRSFRPLSSRPELNNSNFPIMLERYRLKLGAIVFQDDLCAI